MWKVGFAIYNEYGLVVSYFLLCVGLAIHIGGVRKHCNRLGGLGGQAGLQKQLARAASYVVGDDREHGYGQRFDRDSGVLQRVEA